MAGIAKGIALSSDVWPRRSHARRGAGAKPLTRYKLKVCITAPFWLAYILLQCFQFLTFAPFEFHSARFFKQAIFAARFFCFFIS